MSLIHRIASLRFRCLVWLLPAAFTVHEAEEWNILAWYRAEFINPPPTSDLAVRTLLVGFSVLGFLWTAVAWSLPTARASALMVLPFFVIFVLGNALQHLYWRFAFGTYAPGVLTSLLLIIPSVGVVSWHAVRNRIVGWRYVTTLHVLATLMLVGAIRADRTVPSGMQAIHRLGRQMAAIFFGAA